MQIKLTRSTVVDRKSYDAGEVVETDAKTARYIIAIGKAVAFEPPPPAPTRRRVTRPAAVEHRDDLAEAD